MSIKLSDTQLAMLRAAGQRDDFCIARSPTLKGGAAQKVAAKLIAARLAREIKAKDGAPVWRNVDGQAFALKLTATGLKVGAVGRDAVAIASEDASSPEGIVEPPMVVGAGIGLTRPHDRAPREGSKLGEVVAMLRRTEGVTLGDLMATTGWLPHTARAAMTGLRKRGYAVIRERAEEGGSAYRIAGGPAQETGAVSGSLKAGSIRSGRGARAKQAA